MKYPFELIGGFIAWYMNSKNALLITRSDFKDICDSITYKDPMVGAEFKLAVFQGVSFDGSLKEPIDKFQKKLSEKIDDNGWPYSYVFTGEEAISSIESYLAGFCYNNKNYLVDLSTTTVGNKSIISIQKKGFLKKSLVVSFALDSVVKIFGCNAEFFVLMDEDILFYFGAGEIKRMYLDFDKNEYDNLNYFDLMELTYSRR